jgi:hypothetical protein
VEDADSEDEEKEAINKPPKLIHSQIPREKLIHHISIHPRVQLQHTYINIWKEPSFVKKSKSEERESEEDR